jgi:multiple sugar transport system ATP-binding protein
MSEHDVLIRLERVSKFFDDGTVAVKELDLDIEEGAFVCLLGPSGCGKTTTLRMIAGLEHPTIGEIYLRGERITHWPPQRRKVGMVFQSYALFEHLTVHDNLAFGLEVRRVPGRQVRERVRSMARQLELDDVLRVRASRLDLSTMQRVAVGRTLLAEPDVLLLDEPLNNFQAGLREQMRVQLKSWQYQFGRTMVYVTHDQEEAMTLGDRIVVMRDGQVEQIGEPSEVYRYPATLFVAGFIGLPPMNFLPARFDASACRLAMAGAGVEVDASSLRLDGALEEVVAGVRPGHLTPAGAEGADGRPRIRGRVELVRPTAAKTILDVKAEGGQTVRALVPSPFRAAPGDPITLVFQPRHLVVFDPSTKRRIS